MGLTDTSEFPPARAEKMEFNPAETKVFVVPDCTGVLTGQSNTASFFSAAVQHADLHVVHVFTLICFSCG